MKVLVTGGTAMKKGILLACPVTFAAMACASAPKPIPMSASEKVYCAIVADSVATYSRRDRLPLARPVGRPRPPRLPAPLPAGGRATVKFLVRPDGVADTLGLLVTGVDDADFRRRAVAYATGNTFVPGQVQGCPVLSRLDLIITSLGIPRQRSGVPPE